MVKLSSWRSAQRSKSPKVGGYRILRGDEVQWDGRGGGTACDRVVRRGGVG